tara:strand:- start:312 stop:512 length:201 start_codon:yes stop_codon:yes gene_type:complete
MIWAGIFLLCVPSDCLTASTPLFASKDACEKAVEDYGMQRVRETFIGYTVLDWKCVYFGEVNESNA